MMKDNKLSGLLFYLIIFLTPLMLRAQAPVSFSSLTVENGLSQNSVMAVAQDSTGFIWLGTRQGLNRYDGNTFKLYKSDPKNPNSLPAPEITSLLTDHRGILWIGTTNGLCRYDSKNDNFIPSKEIQNTTVEAICQTPDRDIWLGTGNGPILYRNKDNYRKKTFFKLKNTSFGGVYAIYTDKNQHVWLGTLNGLFLITKTKGKYLSRRINLPAQLSNSISAISQSADGSIWIGTSNGMARLSTAGKTLEVYTHQHQRSNTIVHNDIRELMPDDHGRLWIGTQGGLSLLDIKTRQFTNYRNDPDKDESLSSNSIHHIFQDRNKNIWIGTYYGGVNLIYPISTKFKVYRENKSARGISNRVISAITEDQYGHLWLGTEGGGLNVFDKKSNTFKSYTTDPARPNSISSDLVKMISIDPHNNTDLIVGTHRGGLNIFSPASETFRRIKNIKNDRGETGQAEILALAFDKNRKLWIGSFNGLSTLEKRNGQYPAQTSRSFLNPYLKNKPVLCLFTDSHNNLWIGTNSGLYSYNIATKRLSSFRKGDNNPYRLYSDYINCIIESSKGEILVGTAQGGISIYNPEQRNFKTYLQKDGLINNSVVGIVEDNQHNIWISTLNGLSELNTKTLRFRNYTRSDGLAGNEFNNRSFFKDSSGEIFLGGVKGLTTFYPQDIQLNHYLSPLVFSSLRLFNQPVSVNGADGLLKGNINLDDQLKFNYDQNHFTIGFALLNFVKPDKNKYAYKLTGYDRDWNYSNNAFATYTNLPSGNYRFMVRAVNNDGIAARQTISKNMIIRPPLWATWWAWLLYIAVSGFILFLTIRYFFIKALLKKQEDVQKMKLDFFTNVSHEIRTPLTLILGPLERLMKNSENLPEINDQVLSIKNNANRLLRLVNELMDFRKTETGNLKLHLAKQDLVLFLKEIFHSFKQLADSRNISYHFESDVAEASLYFDKWQMEKVFFNLLSNAFKFTPNNGSISLSIFKESRSVKIKVMDNGPGIPESARNKLFTDFFQADEPGNQHAGSGIGLALSQSIVKAHHGQILLESSREAEKNNGQTCFTVILEESNVGLGVENFTIDHELAQHLYIPPLVCQNDEKVKQQYAKDKETILIVEDNPEIRQMLCKVMGADYQVIQAENGQTGWELATEHIPELVICDVMMPVMNGLELCTKIKTDERTAHIPVILLTAKTSHEHQVSGLATGADSYISKPFSLELLMLNARNLIQSRKITRKKFTEQASLEPSERNLSEIDLKFIEKITLHIENKIADQNFGVPELAKEIGISQPVLYKKIRAITDLSVNDFIKTVKLRRAALLVEEGINNVSEIAFLVGFNDAKYFSREFKKQFGQTPKNYKMKKEA